ncbi:unnamed protein product [Somion occarium]|uniref:NAD(P)-binding protein n=1 Tax=Somion occarium TaxID=3059160 RepID=A0ABP1E1K6_9APHY
MSLPKIWLITGASSGFGRYMTEIVLAKGDIAVPTARDLQNLTDLKSRYSADRLLPLKLDVTKSEEITAAFDKVKEVFGRLDFVFNNAGCMAIAEVEGNPDDVARGMFEVNFWGAANISRAAVKFFREVNAPGVGGRLFSISGGLGLFSFPTVGYYCATKHALEGLTEAMAKELDPEWNIKIVIIEPGVFRTNITSTSLIKIPPHPAYAKPTNPSTFVRSLFEPSAESHGSDAAKACEKFYDLAQLPDPPLRFPVGKDVFGRIRTQLKSIADDAEKYESWSEGLE